MSFLILDNITRYAETLEALVQKYQKELDKLSIDNASNNQAGDATWILTSAFIIFTMQSGFGLLEAGMKGWFRGA